MGKSIRMKEIIKAIKDAEKITSAEIVVQIEKKCPTEHPLERAKQLFNKLKMHKTKNRNGVLIYLALKDRKAAIIGDSGIHENTTDKFWNDAYEIMKSDFVQQKYTEGLVKAIALAGEKLAKHFPKEQNDKNELKDDR